MKGNVAGGLPTFQRLATLNPKAKTKSRASFSNTGTLFISANVGVPLYFKSKLPLVRAVVWSPTNDNLFREILIQDKFFLLQFSMNISRIEYFQAINLAQNIPTE
jgi:hypothetical protein